MGNQLNKEKALFLVGALLFVWVAIKLVLCLAQNPLARGNPKVPPPSIARGDANILGLLGIPQLSDYLSRGPREDPFSDASGQPSAVFARSTVQHTLSPAGVISRYAFDCRMIPSPAREIRFKLPAGTEASHVFSKELDRKRSYGHDREKSTLIVYVVPTALKRTYYRCQITVILQSTWRLPADGTQWTAPPVSLKGATDHVVSESGLIALVAPGDRVEMAMATATRKGLNDLRDADIPEQFVSKSTKAVFHYPQPEYELTVPVKAKEIVTAKPVTPVKPTPAPPVPYVKKEPPDITAPVVKVEPPQEKKILIPTADDLEKLPVKLIALVKIETPEPRRQAVFRDKKSGEFHRTFEGETLLDLRIVAIGDSSVTVIDGQGKRLVIPGRFVDKYSP